jgi:ATP-dependent Clp protease ATP-binding subunit ClpB
VKTHFRPEFVNRLDDIVVFHALDEKHIKDIARIQLRQLVGRLAKLELRLVVDDSALDELAKAGFDPVYGARPLKRAIQQTVENPLATQLLEGKYAAGDTVRVAFTGGRMTFEKTANAERAAA